MTGLRLSFLGDPVVSWNGEVIRLKPRKTLALLAYLAVTGGRPSRDALAELLFPRFSRDRARAGVRQCLSVLRRALGSDFVRSDGASVWLQPGFWLDVREAETEAAANEALRQREALFRGDFLDGFFLKDAPGFDAWQRSVEESCRNRHASVLGKLAEIHLAAGNLDAVIECARRWLELDPAAETAHRILMESYARAGRRSEAIRQYERCRETLRKELDAAPEAATEDLHRRISEGLPPEPPGRRPAPTPPVPAHNLPPALTSFVGRERDLSAVLEALRSRERRLLTITGPAGTGKTRLAVEAARRLVGDFPQGVCFVDLVPLREPADVLTAIAGALEVPDRPGAGTSVADRVRDHLRPRKVLLVLDNFEHLLAAADSVARLVAQCPTLTVLATSREALRLQAERAYLLAPLEPDEAVQLFKDRARPFDRGSARSGEDAEAIAGICTRLDDLPLAIELAAGRIRFLPPRKLLSLLETRGSSLLSGGPKDLPSRHQALWRAIEWSHDLLTAPEKTLFQRLAVFRGGFTLEAAGSVCHLDADPDTLGLLESLVEKNLVRQVSPEGEPWYVMLVAIREFAEQRLQDRGDVQRFQERHERYYRAMAEEAEPELDRPAGAEWFGILTREYSNIRSAVEWATEHDVETALRITSALERFFDIQGHSGDAFNWLQRALRKSEGVPGIDALRAKALMAIGNACLGPMLGDQAAAAEEQSVALWRTIGDKVGLARALLVLAIARSYNAPSPDGVLSALDECTRLQRESGDLAGLSHAMFWQAYFTYVKGDTARAEAMIMEERDLAGRVRDVSRFACCAGVRGLMAADIGEYARAASLVKEGLTLIGYDRDLVGTFYHLCSTGGVAFLQGDWDAARAAFTEACGEGYFYPEYVKPIEKVCMGLIALREGRIAESLSWFRDGVDLVGHWGFPWGRQILCACLSGIAGARIEQGFPRLSARILGAAESVLRVPFLRLAWGHDFSTTPTLIKAEFERVHASVRSALGPDAEEAFAEGRSLSLEAAAAIALTEPPAG